MLNFSFKEFVIMFMIKFGLDPLKNVSFLGYSNDLWLKI